VLAWVISGVHWHDYAVTADGRSLRVLDRQAGRVLVADEPGPRWLPAERLQALEGQPVRPGIAGILASVRLPFWLLAAGILAGQLTLMGVRWWYLLRFQGVEVSLAAAVRLMFVGHFFNFFLPGATGGDVVRAYLVTRRTRKRTVAVATVLLDRFVGLAGMALLAAAMTLATWGSPQADRAALAVGVTLGVIAAAAVVLFSRTAARVLHLEELISRLPRGENLRLAMQTLQKLPRSPAASALVAAMTVGVHLLLAAGIACLGRALDLPVPVHLYFLFVPVIYILAAVPISIGGLGLVEGMYVVFFAESSGLAGSPILALALLARVTPMVLSLPGLVFWLAERRRGALPAAGDRPPATAPEGDPPVTGSAASPPARLPGLSVFFPCYNEQGNVRRVVAEALAYLPTVTDDFEIILVDDGSRDRTGTIADELAAGNDRIRAVHHPRNLGYGAALQSGFRAATKPWVFYTDGDGQFDITDMGRLLAHAADCDVVSGYRRRRQDSLLRRVNACLWGWLAERVLGFRCRDVDSAFKLYRREIFDRFEMKSTGALIDAEIIARAVRAGCRLATVPVGHRPRIAGRQTGANVKVIARAFKELFRLRKEIRQTPPPERE
jgi:uncharacterized membrane protein YbhN (UPF0104 family)